MTKTVQKTYPDKIIPSHIVTEYSQRYRCDIIGVIPKNKNADPDVVFLHGAHGDQGLNGLALRSVIQNAR